MIALVESDNEPLVRLLERLGFVYEREVRMPEDDHDINLFSVET
jgi:RimJ/RimL family protein N-acetyltransferase